MAGAVAATVAAALLVSGCGSSEDESGKEDKGGGKPGAAASGSPSGSGSPSASGSGSGSEKTPDEGTGADQPSSDGKPARLAGIWRTKAGGKEFVLTIAGDAVTLLRQQANCKGRVVEDGGKALVLSCPGGTGEDRTNGKVRGLKAKAMKVTWNGGATDTYTKVADAPVKLPKDPKDVEKLIPVR
jgi:hypothetical protein